MKKTNIYEFSPVIYPFSIYITKEFDQEALKERFLAFDGENAREAEESFVAHGNPTARVVWVQERESGEIGWLILLYNLSRIGTGTCAHEALHVANMYLDFIGFNRQGPYNDEPYAYFVQWVANCIDSVLRDKQEEMYGYVVIK